MLIHHGPDDTGLRADVLVVGGGVGGVAAALAACENGATVVLTESTDWIGGQLTSQAVPPDEHQWIEQHGCTARYRAFRAGVRAHYRKHAPLTAAALADPALNPGGGWVSQLCHEPRVALAVLEAMLVPWQRRGRLTVLLEHEPVDAESDGERVAAVILRDLRSGADRTVEAHYVLDATETGELLPLTGTEHVTGFESRNDTGEPDAPEHPQPLNMQAVTVCFAIEHRAGENHTIDEPAGYQRWRTYQPNTWTAPLLSWTAPHPHTGKPRTFTFFPDPGDDPADRAALRSKGVGGDMWTYRRIRARGHLRPARPDADVADITLVNWPMTDYLDGPVFGVPDAATHVAGARDLALSALRWLQTEAPRLDGGTGWPGLRLRPDVMGTDDGLAKKPYIRESRRILAQRRVVAQDLSVAARGERGAVSYPDSVGIGAYRIDLHPSTGGDGYLDVAAWPFQIPLGALVPQRMGNLLAAAKNIGTTHITNGCYRLHPVEWSIGEAAGTFAAFCLSSGLAPHKVTATPGLVEDLQKLLVADGVELAWSGDIRPV